MNSIWRGFEDVYPFEDCNEMAAKRMITTQNHSKMDGFVDSATHRPVALMLSLDL
tara:strand:+ start:600 stop:764 length:165 start_codon:yes stop_codon:yes gene_type:complete